MFSIKETEAEENSVPCPRLYNYIVIGLGFKLSQSDFRVYTPSVASYPINLEVSKVRIVCLGDSLTSGHPFYWD